MRGHAASLPAADRTELLHRRRALLKDAGCSSNLRLV
jgi:hypothetical protein